MARSSPQGVAFPTTHWSLVDRARGGGDGLQDLLRQYAPALEAYLLWTLGVRRQDVEDTLQSFIADKVVAERLVEHANRHRGRFRTFLISVLNNYVSNRRRYDRTQRRSPGAAAAHVDEVDVVDHHAPPPAQAYETAWVRQILMQALSRMEEACRHDHRTATWALFEARVVRPALDATDPPNYDDLVTTLGFATPGDAHNAMVTAKRMLHRHLREVIGEYTRDPAEIDEELAELRQFLSAPRAG
jgi:DNA-directed RNA polymerase specialized sigma24 family protein